MGRVGKATTGRRGLLRRPMLLFGLLLLGPAVGFSLLGWQSVLRERDLRERELVEEARELVDARLDRIAHELDAVRSREEARPYFAYQDQFAPEEMLLQNVGFQPSPLTKVPEDPLVLGWFQWERGPTGDPHPLETFGPDADEWAPGLEATYGPALLAELTRGARSLDIRDERRVEHTLRVVAANEERGQLFEEVQWLRQQRPQEDEEAGLPAQQQVAANGQTPYLDNFFRRIGEDPIPVRYGSFRYLVRPDGMAGPTLVAWRLVWIPSAHEDRREITRDRWLLQGYALAPQQALPRDTERVGAVELRRGDMEPPGSTPRARRGSLAETIDADVLPGPEASPTEELALVARPDAEAVEASFRDGRARFLWLVAGMVVVVAIGFLVLTRGVRREIALARRKQDFVAAVTHELKTPLTGIRMHADMLREGWVRDGEAAARYATRILEESDRLGHLVDQVLDFAALERGVARAYAQPGDLAATVEDAVALMRPRAEATGTTLSFEAEPLPSVTFDPRLVRPLVLNLVDNAIKYSEASETKEVRVTLDRDGDRARLRVADRGVGIAPSLREGLFEPFHRAQDEMTRSASGVGIGLALVRRYADAHDARVVLESEVGHGTTVTVRFPI